MTHKKPSTEKANEINKNTDAESKGPHVTKPEDMPEEFGGTKGLEPTRYGDWEHGGRCTDF